MDRRDQTTPFRDRQIADQLLSGGFRRATTLLRQTPQIKDEPEPVYNREPSALALIQSPRNERAWPSVKTEPLLDYAYSTEAPRRGKGTGNTADPITLSDSEEEQDFEDTIKTDPSVRSPSRNNLIRNSWRVDSVTIDVDQQDASPPRSSSRYTASNTSQIDLAAQNNPSESRDIRPRFPLPSPDNIDEEPFNEEIGEEHADEEDEEAAGLAQIGSLLNLPALDIPKEERMDTPAAMSCTLFEHQKVGLTWLVRQEQDPTKKGGLLADGMGLGKTIEALALILANPPAPNSPYKTTLIIAPVALLQQWKREIREKVKPGAQLKIWVLHGRGTRDMSWHQIKQFDVVLCTYGKLAAEFKTRTTLHRLDHLALLHPQAKFYRVIMDEAQVIKNRAAKASLAAAGLKAKHRLCMTGTPFMNRTVEIYPLIRFLNVAPYNKWETFSEYIDRPLLRWDGEPRDEAMRHLQTFFRSSTLRRTKYSKLDGKPLFELPPRTEYTIKVKLSTDQRNLYRALDSHVKIRVNKYLRAGTFANKYNVVLVLTLRLRQCAVHPFLIRDLGLPEGTTLCNEGMWIVASELRPEVVQRIKAMDELFTCPICETFEENPLIISPCGHHICGSCFENIMAARAEFTRNNKASHSCCPEEYCQVQVRADQIVLYSIFVEAHGRAGEASAVVQSRQEDADGGGMRITVSQQASDDDDYSAFYGFQEAERDAAVQVERGEPDRYLGDDIYDATPSPLSESILTENEADVQQLIEADVQQSIETDVEQIDENAMQVDNETQASQDDARPSSSPSPPHSNDLFVTPSPEEKAEMKRQKAQAKRREARRANREERDRSYRAWLDESGLFDDTLDRTDNEDTASVDSPAVMQSDTEDPSETLLLQEPTGFQLQDTTSIPPDNNSDDKSEVDAMICSYDGADSPAPSTIRPSTYQRRLMQSRRQSGTERYDDFEWDGVDPLVSTRPTSTDSRNPKRYASRDLVEGYTTTQTRKKMRRQEPTTTIQQQQQNLDADTPRRTIERPADNLAPLSHASRTQLSRSRLLANRLLNPKAPASLAQRVRVESAEPEVITLDTDDEDNEDDENGSSMPRPKTLGQLRRDARQNIGALNAYKRRVRRDWVSSAKIDKIMELLADILARRPREKVLIFSLWTSFLDLMVIPLEDARIAHTRYDGYMKPDNREAAIKVFMEDAKVQVMLISLTAGNAGLNLTAAQHVIIVEPFWNPYTEEQAVDRAHRIGQKNRVCVYRLIVPDTIEERIQELQRTKKRLVNAALSEEGAAIAGRLTVADLKALFGL